MSPPLILLLSTVITIQLSMIVGSYLQYRSSPNVITRLWMFGICCMSLALIAASMRPWIPSFLSHEAGWILMVAAFCLMRECIKREIASPTPWMRLFLCIGIWGAGMTVSYFMGWTESFGIAAYSLILFALGIWLIIWVYRVRKVFLDNSLLLVLVGVLFYAMPSLLRLVAYLGTGSNELMNVYKFSIVSNILVFCFVVGVMFISLGYWGFTLSKSEHNSSLARQGQMAAERQSDVMRKLIHERDQLLVMNSRFSVVSSLSSFSAMLIHDISQPLQTLQLGLEQVLKRIQMGANNSEIVKSLRHLESASERAGNLVFALRKLMQSGENQVVSVSLNPLVEQIEGIINSEALQNKARIIVENRMSPQMHVMAEPVMLQRIIINMLSNSLNQFNHHQIATPTVSISIKPEMVNANDGVSIEIQDNGGGFPLAVIERFGQPWSSRQPQGLGMALMLSRQLLSIWSGRLQIANRDDGVAGARVFLWLKAASAT